MKKLDSMKKIVLGLMLMSALSLGAQTTSRIMFGLGGGLSTSQAKGKIENVCRPMGTFNFGYTVLKPVSNEAQLGFRTGLNVTYSQTGNTLAINETFTNIDYYGYAMDYTVTSSKVSYNQKQVNLEVPIMFAVQANGLHFNLGAKLMIPVWNKYNQTIADPQISVYYPDFGVTVLNDVTTGRLTAEQCNITGKAKGPSMMLGLSIELGHTWQISGTNSRLGFDLFFDYVPVSFGAAKADKNSIVEVAPMVNDCEQPKAAVTVNPMNLYNGFNYQGINFGVKLVYAFDVEGK